VTGFSRLTDPAVFVRGKVGMPTIGRLSRAVGTRWLMNTQTQAVAMRHVSFID
jgi:hypothetical protein